METLEQFFEQYIQGTDTSALVKAFERTRTFKKKAFLLKPGQDCSFLAYVNKGSFRVFFYDSEGMDITVWFSFEGMMVGDLLAYYKKSKAFFYIQAVTDSEICIIQKRSLESLYSIQPELLNFGKKYAERVAVNVMERMLSLQTKSAEQRYLELLTTPNFMQKIPLKYLASYLGITDSTLSRIRKNIS